MRFLISLILFLVINSICFSQNNPTKFEKIDWLNLVGVDTIGEKIKKNTSSGWGNSGAFSSNYIESEMKGRLVFIGDDINHKYALGLSKIDVNNHFNTIEFGFYFLGNGKFRIVENGNFKISPTKFDEGDEFSIHRTATSIKYYRNEIEIPIQSDPVSINDNLYADVAFFDNNAFLFKDKIRIKQRKPIVIDEMIENSLCNNATGIINIEISGGKSPYQLYWEGSIGNNNPNSLSLTDLPPGEYVLNVTDALGNSVQKIIRVGVNISWTNLTNISVNQNTIFKPSTSTNIYDSGASTTNYLASNQNGWIEYIVKSNNADLTFGFSITDLNIDFSSIDYSFYVSGNSVKIFGRGNLLGIINSVAVSDVLMIKKVDDKILFYRNEVLLVSDICNDGLLLDVSVKKKDKEHEFKINFCPLQLEPSLFCWARNAKLYNNDESKAVVTDDDGNSYITGYYSNNEITFDGVILPAPAGGNQNLFVAKYSPEGSVIWAKRIYTEGGNSEGLGITLVNNKVLVTGYFTGAMRFEDIGTDLISKGGEDIFYACFTTSGSQVWAKSGGGPGNDRGQSITANANVTYVTGFFNIDCSFASIKIQTVGSKDCFVLQAKTPDGLPLWLDNIGGINDDEGKSITIISDESCLLTGYFTEELKRPNIMGGGGKDFFVAKYKSDGNLLWLKNAGDDKDQEGLAICADKIDGDAYVTGYFQSRMPLSPNITLTVSAPNVGTNSDVFVIRYDSNGVPIWGQTTKGTGYDYGMGIALENPTSKSVYVTGYYSNTLSMNGVTTTLPSLGNKNVFVLKLNNEGVPKLFLSGGKQYEEIGYGISVDKVSNIYLTGSFNYQSKFGNIELQAESDFKDLFIAKICRENICSTQLEEEGSVIICDGQKTPVEIIELPNIARNEYLVGSQTIYSPPLSTYSGFPISGLSYLNGDIYVGPSVSTNYVITATNYNGCVSTFTVVVEVVPNNLTSGTIGFSTKICYGEVAPTLTNVSFPTGGPTPGYYSYDWQSSSNGVDFNNVSGNYVAILGISPATYTATISSSYTPTEALTATTYYKRNVESGVCGVKSSNIVTITVVNDITVSDISTYNPVICFGQAQPTMTLSASPTGGNGTFTYQWQKSSNNISFTDISGANNSSYTPPVPTTYGTIYYRIKVISDNCFEYSNSTFITTLQELVAGTLSLSTSPCVPGTPIIISLSNSTGGNNLTYKWEYSSDLITWQLLPAGPNTYTYISAISSYTMDNYRAVVTSDQNCVARTNPININEHVLNPGAIGSNQFVCYSQQPSLISNTAAATATTGSIAYQWQYSLNGNTWETIAGAQSPTYLPGQLTTTTLYRRVANTSLCGSAFSNVITIDVAKPINLEPFNSVVLNSEVMMVGGTPLGGTYTINGFAYYPSYTAITIGTHTITYSIEVNGCATFTSQNIVVVDPIAYEYTADETTGISFNNYGAYVFLSDYQDIIASISKPYFLADSAKLNSINIVGNLLNENATNNRVFDGNKKGVFINNGTIRVTKDWTNNAGDLFPTTYTIMTSSAILTSYSLVYNNGFASGITPPYSNYGLVEFNGENQNIKGNSITQFYDVNLKGTGIKSLYIDAHINKNLDLKHLEFATRENTLLIKNTANNAIIRTDGFVSSNYFEGKLSRTISNNGVYLFPLGSSNLNTRYRPVSISSDYDNTMGSQNFTFDARLINNSADDPENPSVATSNHPLSKKYQDVYEVTDKYYYKLEKNGQLDRSTDLGFFYLPGIDGNYNAVAVWTTNPVSPTIFTSATNNPPYWKNTRSLFDLTQAADNTAHNNLLNSNQQYNSMNMLGVKQWSWNNAFGENFFAIEKAGFVINTGGGFGGQNSVTNLTVTGPCDANGINCSNSVYGNTNGNAEGSGGGAFTNLPLAGNYCFTYAENTDNTGIKVCFTVDESGNVTSPVVHQSGLTTFTSTSGFPFLADDLYQIVNGTTLLLKADPLQSKLCDFTSPVKIDFTDNVNHSATTLKNNYKFNLINNSTTSLSVLIDKIEITKKDGTQSTIIINGSSLNSSVNELWDGKISTVKYPGVYDVKIVFNQNASLTKEFYGQFIVE